MMTERSLRVATDAWRVRARSQVEARHLTQLLHPTFADEASYRNDKKVVATGLAASPGAAVGRLVFSANEAEEWSKKVRAKGLKRGRTGRVTRGTVRAVQGARWAHGRCAFLLLLLERWAGSAALAARLVTPESGAVAAAEGELKSVCAWHTRLVPPCRASW